MQNREVECGAKASDMCSCDPEVDMESCVNGIRLPELSQH